VSRVEAVLREKRSRGGKALVVFLMLGYPDVDTFEGLLFAAEAAGADVVEVGLPFSDPVADGPVIRRASQLALAAGATVTSLFECVAGCRARGLRVPIVLMTYFEPVRVFGTAGLCSAAAEAGIDGMLVADLAPEGIDAFVESATAAGLEKVVLVTPRIPERMIPAIVIRCSGFVYCASVDGVTGGET
jgi:tryptophan synthase alpha chain